MKPKKPKDVDLGLVNSDGHGRPVPTEVELEIIRYVVGQRIRAVEANPNLLIWERWTICENNNNSEYSWLCEQYSADI